MSTDKKVVLSMEELVGIAKGAGFSTDQAVVMAAIAKAQSSGNLYNNTPPVNFGVWGINMGGAVGEDRKKDLKLTANEELFNPVTSAKAAFYLFKQSNGNYAAFESYSDNSWRKFYAEAQAVKNAQPITQWKGTVDTSPKPVPTPKPPEQSEGGGILDSLTDVGLWFGSFAPGAAGQAAEAARIAKNTVDKAKEDKRQAEQDAKDDVFSEAELNALKQQFPPDDGTERYKELEIFVIKLVSAATMYRNGTYQSELWPSTRIQGETIFKSSIESFNVSKGVPPKGIIPTELSMTVDGISGINIGEAFMIQEGILPKKYNDFGFIVVGLDQGIKSNRWYTTIRAQTFNIGQLLPEQIAQATTRITPWGYY